MTTNRVATYECLALAGTNKTGALKPDDDGYYTLVLGAINVFNYSGAFYNAPKAVRNIFESPTSIFKRTIESGNCKAEMGHPMPEPGQTKASYLQRLKNIDLTNVCAHIRKVYLVENADKSITIMGELKPSGPHGDDLKASLENKHENVCFSIRSISNDTISVQGQLTKQIKTVYTFDRVNEPGIDRATKWNAPALESLSEITFTPDDLMVDELSTTATNGVSLEAQENATELCKILGWDKPEVVSSKLPPSTEW